MWQPRGFILISAVLFSLSLASSSAVGELTPDQQKAAQALVKQLSAPEFQLRQQAVEKLIGMGRDVAPLLKKTMAETADAEVKLRCQMALKGITDKYGATVDGLDAKGMNYGPSLITLDVKDAALTDVLADLAAKSGNAPIVTIDRIRGPHGLWDELAPAKPMTVTLSVKDKPYWEVLDMICQPIDLCYDFGRDAKNKMRLRTTPNKGEEKGAYSGPVVVKLDRVQKSETVSNTASFRTDPNTGNPPVNKQLSVNYQLRYFVEDRLPILSSWLEFTKATTEDGVDHISPQMREQMGWNRRGFSSNQGNPSCGQAQFWVQNEDAKIDKPLTLQGKVLVEATTGAKELKLTGLRLEAAPGDKSAQDDGIEVRLTAIDKQGFNVKLSFELSADATVPIFTGGTEAQFGFALVDSKGKRYNNITQFEWKSQNGSSSGGGGPMGNRLDQFGGQPGKPLDGKLTLTFGGVRTAEGDWSVVLTYPEHLGTREFPFTIKDIPVP